MGCSVGRYAIDQNFKQVIFSVCGCFFLQFGWRSKERWRRNPEAQVYNQMSDWCLKTRQTFSALWYFFSTSIVNSSFSTATCTLYIYTCISILCHTFAEMLGWTCCNKLTQKLMMIVVRVMMMMPQWGGLAHPENPLHGWGGSDPSRRYKNPICL